jgi:cytoskeletal protein CcmA (bactofilin family)
MRRLCNPKGLSSSADRPQVLAAHDFPASGLVGDIGGGYGNPRSGPRGEFMCYSRSFPGHFVARHSRCSPNHTSFGEPMLLRKLNPTLWILPALAALILALGQPPAAMAAETRGGTDITIGSGETIDDDLYAFGQNVTILGNVTGSVITGGNTVTVSGDVGGDVMAAGSTVMVDGPVRGSVRAAGQSVQVRNHIDGDLLATANSVSLVGDGRVGRDLLAAGTLLTIAGPVGRDVNASGQDVRLSSSVGGQVTSNATNLRLDSTAHVQGGVSYTSAREAEVAPGATVEGPITRSEPVGQDAAPATALALDWLKGVVGLAVLGLVLLALFPGAARRNVAALRHSPWASLGLGALVLVAMPVLAVVVFGAGLWLGGWWLGLLLLGAYVVWLVLGYLVSAATLGGELLRRVRPQTGFRVWGLLLGLLLLAALQLIPFVGGLIGLVAVLFGSGALLLTIRSARTSRRAALSPAAPAPMPNAASAATTAVP